MVELDAVTFSKAGLSCFTMEVMDEMECLLENIHVTKTVYFDNHASNYLSLR